ncbi:MAG: NAD kinase [Sphingobacteriia bacterium]|nr:NAD kinase [Sphingobacteriia bacterium]
MKIHCIADTSPTAQEALNLIKQHNPSLIFEEPGITKEEVIIVVIGGDGFMLHILHKYIKLPHRFFGLNAGTVGFLMNQFSPDNLIKRIEEAELTALHPLKMEIVDINNNKNDALAINEVALFRQTNQSAHLKISINNKVKLEQMVGDGILISTPAGSSAYNFSAGGPIIPLEANILALTALNPYRPKRWSCALIPDTSEVEVEILNHEKRPVGISADFIEYRDVLNAKIYLDRTKDIKLLFDPEHSLEERILNEQFK